MNKVLSWVGITVALVIAIVALVYPKAAPQLGKGVTNYDTIGGTTLQIGSGCNDSYATCTGTAYTFLKSITNGTVIGANLAQAATTSQAYDIAVTGVIAGDSVLVNLPTTTPTTNLGWRLVGANASSTNGYVTVILFNGTGGTQSVAAGGNLGSNSWGSTTQITVHRP